MSWFPDWARWYLGRGKYKGHARNRDLRPPAPGKIPAAAWARLHKLIAPISADARLRARIVSYLKWGIANAAQIHYAQQRPMEDVRSPLRLKTLPRWADCSEFVTDAYAWAGAPDPNGLGYSGAGYTGTLYAHGMEISISQALPGDLVIFGTNPTEHVAAVIEAGSDPLLASHGAEIGPLSIRFSVEKGYHAGQTVTFLRSLQ